MNLRQLLSRTPPPDAAGKHAFLLTMEIFRDLAPDEVRAFEQQTVMRTCPRGQVLYAQDDRAEALFLLKRGQVRLYRLTAGGKRLELAQLGPGTFFGEMPLLGESLRHTFAEVSEEALVCVMSRADVERIIQHYPPVALRMLEVLGKRLANREERLEELAYKHVPARVAAVLLRLAREQRPLARDGTDEPRDGATITLTHQELGDMIGALRETVTAILNEFQRAGLVSLGRGHITLRDVAGLREQLDIA